MWTRKVEVETAQMGLADEPALVCSEAAFAQAFPDSLNILLLDTSGAHTAQRLRWPENVRAVWLPPYCPELNPIERLWRDLKDALAWQQCVDLEAQQRDVAALWQA